MTSESERKLDTFASEEKEDEDIDAILGDFIDKEEAVTKQPESADEVEEDQDRTRTPTPGKFFASDSEDETEKGQQETVGEKDNVLKDSNNLPDDQRRAMEELDTQRIINDEEPPEYDVTERVKKLNEQLKSEPMPDENKSHKISFKEKLVDLVAPPPDYDEDETPRNVDGSSSELKPETTQNNSDKPKENKVLMEIGGKFELVNADDVRAKDFGLPVFDNDKENKDTSNLGANRNINNNNNFNRKPVPPSNPRPSTANVSSSRRSVRPAPKARAQSAGIQRYDNIADYSGYNSPYALSKKEKDMLEQRIQQKKELEQEEKRRKQEEERRRREENEDAFKAWLKNTRKREEMRKQQEEDEKRKNQAPDKRKSNRSECKNTGQQTNDANSGDEYDDDDDDEKECKENTEAYQSWLQFKADQIRKEKLLKKRQEQEQNQGFIIRSREECDRAFREWLRRKNTDLKKLRTAEKSRSRVARIAARKARKAHSLTKAIRQSNAFRYVDYYGYRF